VQGKRIAENVVALAGGVGGAKLAQGLAGVVESDCLTVVINTADDFRLWGLHISPDLDTVMYTLAGIANPAKGWGVVDDTHHTLQALAGYGVNPWFSLGDRDFATHIIRTEQLGKGVSLTAITRQLSQALGIAVSLIPMTDDPVATRIRSGNDILDFQEYFVARRQEDVVDGVTFAGIEDAVASSEALQALDAASVIVFCPSNPIVSIGPILDVPGMRDVIRQSHAVKVGVSPIVGGKALKGPADKMLASLGHEASSLGIARIYQDLLDILVIDETDRELAEPIRALGLDVLVTQSIMGGTVDRERLALEVVTEAQLHRSHV
jgi:LPPG:FO 2-phospho-L-lactate transferase